VLIGLSQKETFLLVFIPFLQKGKHLSGAILRH